MSMSDKRAQVSANNAAILENVQKVHDAGYNKGYSEGVASSDAAESYERGKAEGIEEGKQAEYDAFWNGVQRNGTRTAYPYAFASSSWTDDTFKPMYDIVPTAECHNMFNTTGITDLTAALERSGVTLDTSKSPRMDSMFTYATSITRVPVISSVGSTYTGKDLNNMFSNCRNLVTIDGIILKDDGTIAGASMFANCNSLVNVTFSGVIGTTGWNFNSCPLSVASMKNIISCLKDLTGTDGEGVYTIKFSSVCWEELEADSMYDTENNITWSEYVGSLGWVV